MGKLRLTSKAKNVGRILLILAVVGAASFGVYKYYGTGNEQTGEGSSIFGGSKEKFDATMIVDTYTGWAPIIWGNGGCEGTDNSYFATEFGLKLKILFMDDFEAGRAALKNGDANFAFVTLDSYPVETSSTGTMTDFRYFMIHNFSAGADAIVVNKSINTVQDLKGKKIAFSEGTASHSLLLNTLETAGLTNDDIIQVKTGYGTEVAQAFKAKKVDAAVVFTPDDDDCIAAFPKGEIKVLTSTVQANTLITDGFIAKKEWLESNPDLVKKIIQAFLWANSEIVYGNKYDEACQAFSLATDVPVEFAQTVGMKINFATLEDNINWFGLNPIYSGVTGEKLYNRMAKVYTDLNLTRSVLPWYKVSTDRFIKELSDNNKLTNNQTAWATKEKIFTEPTPEVVTKPAISNKKVVINFPTNGYTLDYTAKATIDNEFVDIAEQFNQVRIRVEGNTDNTGNRAYNVDLSYKRAKAVVNYLVNEHNMDPNRFIVVGNGPKHAEEDGVTGANENYRTTDFQLVVED
jgi:NitT/TauT family transport system substrate-binding protein